jgi:hypothetical protein
MAQPVGATVSPPVGGFAPVTDEEIVGAMPLAASWITAAGVRRTLATLQPYYPNERLSAEAGVEIMRTLGRLFSILRGNGTPG